jgi:hypothetical protein
MRSAVRLGAGAVDGPWGGLGPQTRIDRTAEGAENTEGWVT